jgi:hypothetical protein
MDIIYIDKCWYEIQEQKMFSMVFWHILAHFELCVHLHITAWEPLNGFLLNLIFLSFTKIYQHIPVLIKITHW